MTPAPILSAAQKDAVASAAVAIMAVQQASAALAAHGGPRRRPVSSGIFGQPVYDRDPGMTMRATTPTVVPYGSPLVRPVVAQGPGPIIGEGTKVRVGGKVPIGQRYTGQTVFSGPQQYPGMYGSSIFGGGVSGLGATERGIRRARRGGRISGLGEVDSKGFERAPLRPGATTQYQRCGFLGRMLHWDAAWPCTQATADAALNAQIAWWKANPANQAAENAAGSNPNGIPPYRKGAWITAMCAGMAPIPPGLTRPSVCQTPAAPPTYVAPPPAPFVSPVRVGGSALVSPTMTTAAVAPVNKTTLLIVGGLALAAVGTFVLLKGKKSAPAAAAAT